MKLNQKILSMLFTGFLIVLTGCGSDPKADQETNSTKGLVGNSFYLINPSVTNQDVPELQATLMNAGGTQTVSAFAAQRNNSRVLTQTAGEAITTSELRASIEFLNNSVPDLNLSTINEQVYSKYSEFTVGDYSFTMPSAQSTTTLTNQILNSLMDTNVSLPAAAPGAATATDFRMFMTVASFNGNYYYIVSISTNTAFNDNFGLMTALSSGSNFNGSNERLVSSTENFVGRPGTTNQADFLFVIDDSGSMGDQQAALSTAANDFDNALQLANMDYNIAIITTSEGADGAPCTGVNYCYDRSVQNVGIIDNDINTFKTEVVAIDTNGSPTETGIYNAEQSLKKVANGDSFDGLLNTAPLSFPRDNTQLSVIILSDEPSQYESRSDDIPFSPTNNLFIRDGILVNAIVDTGLCGADSVNAPGQDPNGQYDDLAIATGGLVGNICRKINNVPNFSAIMQNIVFQAAGRYRLNFNYVKPNSIIVKVDGVDQPVSIIQGYMFIEGTNSIAFFGTLPAEGSDIEVYYEYPKEIKYFAND